MLKKIKRILCPVDLYDFQPEAAEYAMAVADAFDAEIAVVYVLEPLPPRYFGECDPVHSPFAEEQEASRKAEAKLPEIIREFFSPRADKGEVVLGYAADKIVQAAKEYSADMIIMASHDRPMLGRIIHGSVTNKVLANTKVPVLVVYPTEK